MKDQFIEVEITGPLPKETLDRIRYQATKWSFKGHFDRYLINFTTDEMRRRELDVRARITNSNTELIVKRGEWGSGKRLETLVQCDRGQFEPLVHALVALGFSDGVGCHRVIDRFTDQDIEFSIIEVPNYTFFYEAELMVPLGTQDVAMERLMQWAESFGLSIFNKEQFLKFIDELDANANDALSLNQEASWLILKERIRNQNQV